MVNPVSCSLIALLRVLCRDLSPLIPVSCFPIQGRGISDSLKILMLAIMQVMAVIRKTLATFYCSEIRLRSSVTVSGCETATFTFPVGSVW